MCPTDCPEDNRDMLCATDLVTVSGEKIDASMVYTMFAAVEP